MWAQWIFLGMAAAVVGSGVLVFVRGLRTNTLDRWGRSTDMTSVIMALVDLAAGVILVVVGLTGIWWVYHPPAV